MLAAAAGSSAAGFTLPFLLLRPAGETGMSFAGQYLMVALQETLLIGLPALALTLRAGGKEALARGLRSPGIYHAGLTTLSAVSFSLAGVLVTAFWLSFLSLFGITQEESALMDPKTAAELVAALLCAALIPALSEELMFRGVLLSLIKRKAGGARAAVISGALFALFHLSLQGMAALMVIGAFLSALTIRSGGLFLPILFHFVYNAVAIALNALGAKPSFTMVLFSTAVFSVTVFRLLKKEGSQAWNSW